MNISKKGTNAKHYPIIHRKKGEIIHEVWGDSWEILHEGNYLNCPYPRTSCPDCINFEEAKSKKFKVCPFYNPNKEINEQNHCPNIQKTTL